MPVLDDECPSERPMEVEDLGRFEIDDDITTRNRRATGSLRIPEVLAEQRAAT
jgi:hypothetical protein